MKSESDNLPKGGTDTALSNDTALSLDEAAGIDFYDPSEEEDNGEGDMGQQSGDATDEAEDGQQAEDTTAEDDDQTEEEDEGAEVETGQTDEPEPTDDVTVTVNGEAIPLRELKSGYMRQADYSRKTQEVATTRRDLEALSARVTKTVDVIADYLVKQIPPAPDPQLAMTNPGEFVQKEALHKAAMAQVNALLEQAGEVTEVANTLTVEQRREQLASEDAKLTEAFPMTRTKEGRKQFFTEAATAARELGYSDDEIKGAIDHRMFALAHYAAIGMRAEKAQAKAKQKVQNAPPVAPQKARPQNGQQAGARKNQEAMKRLSRTGSIHDAMRIDFD